VQGLTKVTMDKSGANKRLIEVDFPLREVSEQSVREKNIRHGHISTLHIWWARRPLAASRATALAALLPDPGDPQKREEYLQLIKDISPWEVVSKDTPQNRALLEKARKLIREAYGGRAPKVLDCFAGGGAIPLEALRLGCETYALDYNPVAVLILKAVLEYPQKYGQPQIVQDAARTGLGMKAQRTVNPLLEEVKRWGNWVLEEARKELEQFYPRDKDGSIPVGYIWARTLPCQNPECGAEIPLLLQTWLSKKKEKKVALRVVADKARKGITFEIAEGRKIDFNPDEGTISAGHVRCPICGGTFDDETTRALFRERKAGQRMVAVVVQRSRGNGKHYRLSNETDLRLFEGTLDALRTKRELLREKWEIDPLPDERLPTERPSPNARGVSAITRYEMQAWADLFNARQALALITFTEKVRQAHTAMLRQGREADFAKAVVTYLALTVDELARFGSVLNRWKVDAEAVVHVFARPALAMLWDYFENVPVGSHGGTWEHRLSEVMTVLSNLTLFGDLGIVTSGSATNLPWPEDYFDAVLTDPPYYDNVPYSDLSDFFYVWMKRTIGGLYPELLATPLTPKTDEIVWHQRHGGSYEAGKEFFERNITAAFREIQRVLKPDGNATIIFAHKTTDAWEAVISALLDGGLYMTSSWPIHTEMEARLNAQETASLASSIYMVCRKRMTQEVGEFPKVKHEIEERVREKLDKFWSEGIRGADFFMSAIGPAVEVFGRYERVEKLSGEKVEVKELLEYVRKVVSEYALEHILGSAELGGVDAETRFYLLWRWTYNNARVPFDEARKLATAVGTELTELWKSGNLVSKEKEYVRVLGPKDREKDSKFMRQERFNTMVDALHRAILYWERSERQKLKEHLAQTYGATDIFWRVAQHIAEVLPEGDKEKQLLQGLLYGSRAQAEVKPTSGKLFDE